MLKHFKQKNYVDKLINYSIPTLKLMSVEYLMQCRYKCSNIMYCQTSNEKQFENNLFCGNQN